MKKFLKTVVLSAILAGGTASFDAYTTGHTDLHSVIVAGLAGIVGLWIKKPGTENHESPLATGK